MSPDRRRHRGAHPEDARLFGLNLGRMIVERHVPDAWVINPAGENEA